MSRPISWYVRRLRRMSGREVAGRIADRGRQLAWNGRWVRPGEPAPLPRGVLTDRAFPTPLPPGARAAVPLGVRERVVEAADRVLAGDWSLLGLQRDDIADPDWFLDPATGRRAPQAAYAFRIDHRDESVTGNVKNVWELSRHHHLTLVAAAWWLTGDDRYAENVAAQLRSWWAANPFLSGIHWTSGIELGVRLISWAWIRRFLDEWPGVEQLFDDDAVRQIWWHQTYLEAFRSRGSSANNHVVAEEAGRLVAACAFPWYAESRAWRASAATALERELARNTFPSGLNRELATDYHRFVTELALVGAAEADAAGHPLGDPTWALVTRSLDAAAAILDATGRPPRQGDGDEGRALVVDVMDPWAELLAAGEVVVGGSPWWPTTSGTGLLAVALGALAPYRRATSGRPATRPDDFPDAGLTILRTEPGVRPEIWCRCDGGPHGFLSIAAHGHADALSIEMRYDGVELLVDPGTYCYHGEPEWRRYFRSTLAHNTVEVDGVDQSVASGPFLWERHAQTVVEQLDGGRTWAARHNGYERLGVTHRRTVTLDRSNSALRIVDRLTSSDTATHRARIAFHLGPDVQATVTEGRAVLAWPGGGATLELQTGLTWSMHRGETAPPLGWHSPNFGIKTPITTILGSGSFDGVLEVVTELRLTAGDRAAARTPDEMIANAPGG